MATHRGGRVCTVHEKFTNNAYKIRRKMAQ